MLIDICIRFREYSLSGFQVIEWTRFVTDRQTDGRIDGRTDGQTDGRPGKNNMSPDPEGGRHNDARRFILYVYKVSAKTTGPVKRY